MSPRQSFAKWQEAIEHRCEPWEPAVVEMAQRLRQRVLRLEAEFTAESVVRHNEELRQISFAASHDLREPLRTLLNYIDLLADELTPLVTPEQSRYIERIEMAIRRMQGLVDDLLTYADLSRDDDWESVDLGVLCREVVEDFGDIIERTGAVVTIGDLPVITGTKINLRRLLLNLIGNSLKYVAPGVAPVVEITSQHANGMIEIAVSDNGIGIAAENFERIFDFFGRLHHADEYTGSGMGLSICRRVVENMGGTMRVDSEPGKGSTFTCSFHLSQEAKS